MRLLPGRTLAHRIAAEGRLAPVDAARLAHEIAQALAAAHERGVVHRDIKPENVLLDRAGHAIVTDFGVARITARGDRDGPGLSLGTPGYMSPEQILGEPVDGKADVYSLGVVLFEMLTGRPPFAAPTVSGLMLKHLSESPPHLTQYQRDVPTALATITKQALAKNPEARPSAADLCGQLAAAREPEKLLAPRRARWRRVRRRLPLMGVAVIASVAIWGITAAVVRIADFLTSGDQPRVDILGPSIPKLLADSLRGEGLLRGNEVMLYVFAPSSAKEREMLVITDSAFIWRGRSGTRRYQKPAGLTFGATKGWNTGRARGFLGVALPTGKVDTLFTRLSGTDLTRFISSLRSLETIAQSVRPMDSVK